MIFTAIFRLLFSVALVAGKGWVSLEVSVPKNMSGVDDVFPTVPIFLGQPEQRMDLTLMLDGSFLAAYHEDCPFCLGPDRYDPALSSTSKGPTQPWEHVWTSGHWYQEVLNIGHVLSAQDIDIMSIEYFKHNYPARQPNNGFMPLFVHPFRNNATAFLNALWESGQLTNPVVGLRLDGNRPRLTMGALDRNDYVGELNWVPLEMPPSNNDFSNGFRIDGIKGYNGTFLPMGDAIVATINSYFQSVSIPADSNVYAMEPGYIGPDRSPMLHFYPYSLDPRDIQGVAIQCDWDRGVIPQIYFTVTINGFDYPLNDMLTNTTFHSEPGYCSINLKNSTETETGTPDVSLGAPFLRSVYLAYRFPTGSCPGYYGFAFLSDSPYPVSDSLVSQQPGSTPSSYSECIANVLTPPTSTPTPTAALGALQGVRTPEGSYSVYRRPQDGSVSLLAPEELPQGFWYPQKRNISSADSD